MSMELVTQDIYAIEPEFNRACVDKSIVFKAEANFALQLLEQNSYLLDVATKNRQSLANAVMNVAAIGVSLNPATKQAYLVPRKGAICLDISYRGLTDMAVASGAVRWAQARMVYANDHFRLNGIDKEPTHEFDPFSTDRGDLIGVYAIAKTADGDFLTHPMAIDDVYAIRNRSESWKSGRSSPWKTDEAEMVKKTAVKQAQKYWPRSERLDRAIHYLNTDGGEGIEFAERGEQAQEAPARGKPAVKMPRARSDADVTDVEPRQAPAPQPTADRPASRGEINWVLGKLKALGETIEGAAGRAGLGLTDASQMTRSDFVALREVLA